VRTVEERSYVEAARRDKRAALEARGVLAFAYRYERSHTAAEALAAYRDEMGDSGPRVRIAGRVDRLGSHGKTTFAHVEDPTGRIQVYFRQDTLGDGYAIVELLDLDDHIGVEGTLFRTKKGEITIKADSLTMLAKSLRPLPRGKTQQTDTGIVSYGDLQDPEVRYRQRYADLAVHSEVRQIFVLRAKAVTFLRRFLDERGFLEVETPILQPLYGGAAATRSPTTSGPIASIESASPPTL
jgi:lysyl-tRNA synthetase class 2